MSLHSTEKENKINKINILQNVRVCNPNEHHTIISYIFYEGPMNQISLFIQM